MIFFKEFRLVDRFSYIVLCSYINFIFKDMLSKLRGTFEQKLKTLYVLPFSWDLGNIKQKIF